MIKLLISASILWSFTVTAGLPPTTLAGQSAASNVTTFNFKTPYNQSTQLNGVNSLIETGNENMLVDGGMEASGVAAWTCPGGASQTCTKTTTAGEFSSGAQALKIALSAGNLSVTQNVNTTSGIQTQGVVGLLYKVPSTITDFQICTLIATLTQTCTLASNIINDNNYHQIEIPVIMTPGSQVGFVVKTTASYTANVFIDAAYIKQGFGYQALMQDTVYSAQVTTTSGVVTNQTKSFIASCTAANATVCTFTTGIFTVAPNCTASVTSNAAAAAVSISSLSSTSITISSFTTTSGALVASYPFTLTCQKTGADYANASSAAYVSTNGDYDWTNFGSFTANATVGGAGTLTGNANGFPCKSRRVGGDLESSCSFTTGTPTAVLGSVLLPNGLTIDTNRVLSTNTTSGAGQVVGGWYCNSGTNAIYSGAIVLATGTSTSLVYTGASSNESSQLVPQLFNGLCGSSFVTSLYFKVPISGWSNSNLIVGSFAGYNSTAGITNPKVFSATITTTSGVISNNNGGIFSSCTSANPTVCTLIGLTVAPICSTATYTSAVNGIEQITAGATSTSITIGTYTSTTGSPVASLPFNIFCQGY